MSVRDDFTLSVKRVLAQRVQYCCSNPDCCANTSGPQADPAKAINLGVAAHITAAAPDGPRYDHALTPQARTSADNGIWLCQNCAKMVDDDPSQYTVNVLRDWKGRAEADARRLLGKTASGNQPCDQVGDKWVSIDYAEKAGIDSHLKGEGYVLRWEQARNEATKVDLEGWERVVICEPDGSQVYLKVSGDPAFGGYQILLRKRFDGRTMSG